MCGNNMSAPLPAIIPAARKATAAVSGGSRGSEGTLGPLLTTALRAGVLKFWHPELTNASVYRFCVGLFGHCLLIFSLVGDFPSWIGRYRVGTIIFNNSNEMGSCNSTYMIKGLMLMNSRIV
uniref:Uncharacterized protein n=1 Tax=Equus asinus TaxID=9793 RepID=A0A9L0IA57_EQUAS